MIELRGLTKVYGPTKAVDDLSFTVKPGIVTGFLGPNGAGKSTTMRMILGLDQPTSGAALIEGKPYHELKTPLRTVGALSVCIQFLVTFGVFLLLVQYLQLILGYGPLTAALALTPMVVPLIVISVIAPWLSNIVGLRVMTTVGLLTIAAGLVMVSRLTVAATYPDLLWPLLIMSAGLGLCTAPDRKSTRLNSSH